MHTIKSSPSDTMTPNNITDKTANGMEIEAKTSEGLTYLEAVVEWLEENSIEIKDYQKYVPKAIIHKVTQECIESDMIRPSAKRSLTHNTLDFLMV